MSLYWLLFASLTVVGALTYNLSVKFGTASMPVFIFVLIAAATNLSIQAVVTLTAKYGFKYDLQGVNSQNIRYALMAGAATALIDIAYFFALRYGSMVASQIFWTVGGSIAVTAVAVLFLHETLTFTKAMGIALGMVAVVLLTKQS
jgi:uncharacterized membrane protein